MVIMHELPHTEIVNYGSVRLASYIYLDATTALY